MTIDIRTELDKVARDEVFMKRLIAHTRHSLRNVSDRDKLGLAEDFVSEAMCKILTGERTWNPEVTVKFKDFLASTVKSLVWNYKQNKMNRIKIAREDVDLEGVAGVSDSVHKKMEHDEFFLQMFEVAAGDDTCEAIVDCYEKGLHKPGDIAQSLGIKPTDVINGLRRLRRRTSDDLKTELFGVMT